MYTAASERCSGTRALPHAGLLLLQAPGVDETGVFLLGECKERAYKRWFLNCCKAEQGRTMQMDTLGMKVCGTPSPLSAHASPHCYPDRRG